MFKDFVFNRKITLNLVPNLAKPGNVGRHLKKNMNNTCEHEFIEELDFKNVTWEIRTLFVGTFNPGCCKAEENSATWFYGRTQLNMFWNTVGFLYENNPTLGSDGNEII